jgi:glycosyltransferase involved in cell wall biosynthesis
MLGERTVCVVVPAFDEAERIESTVRTVPRFVDRIVVVDDGSGDGTAEVAAAVDDPRVTVVRHGTNRGVGRAISTGYAHALAEDFDVTVVVGGDGQMHPGDMRALVETVLEGGFDYAKGNRLLRREGWLDMPLTRLFGTLALSVVTAAVTGYWRSFDSQCGYTAIGRAALERVPLDELFPRYGYPNDLLSHLARQGATVRDVAVRIRYGPGTSKMRIPRVILPISGVLFRSLFRRVGWV